MSSAATEWTPACELCHEPIESGQLCQDCAQDEWLTENKARVLRFIRLAADTGYDGRGCSHEDGRHDLADCPSGHGCAECCDPWDVPNDEEHDNLLLLVEAAQDLLAAMEGDDHTQEVTE